MPRIKLYFIEGDLCVCVYCPWCCCLAGTDGVIVFAFLLFIIGPIGTTFITLVTMFLLLVGTNLVSVSCLGRIYDSISEI